MKSKMRRRGMMIITGCMVMIGMLFAAVSVNAAEAPECPSITSLTSKNCSVTVKWGDTDNPAGTRVEVIDATHKKTYNVQESQQSLTIRNLTAGEKVKVCIRAASGGSEYICSNWTDPRTVTVKSGSGNAVYVDGHKARKINLDTWYSISNEGKEDTDDWSYSKYYYLKAVNSGSDYELHVKTSEGEVRVFPYYRSGGSWSRGMDDVCAEASCSETEELWDMDDEIKAGDIIGFEAIAASNYGEVCSGKFMITEVTY